MTYGSLFTGIGGLDLALEALGHGPALWQAEIDPHARAVLAEHWPDVRCYLDVKEIDARARRPDVICGGFPCQDISNAGKRVGIDGERSGLWSEYARIVRELRPRVVFVENVAPLLVRGIDRVLGDLAALGYDAEWEVFRASDVGAPHLRARVFVLGYADGDALRLLAERDQRRGRREREAEREHAEPVDDRGAVADADELGGREGFGGAVLLERSRAHGASRDEHLADADGGRREGVGLTQPRRLEGQPGRIADGGGHVGHEHCFPPGPSGIGGWDGPQPAIRRGNDGVPGRIHRLRLLGNAVVWQQAALAFETLTARALRN